MVLEPIFRCNFDNPEEQDRTDLQESIIAQVEADPDYFLAKYELDPRSFNGRYVSADLFKEMFVEYAESKETRARYIDVVHNSSAVLSAKQLNRVIADSDRDGDEVIFLTGIPGAGKTSSIQTAGKLPPQYRAIFEGQLWRPEPAIPKMQAALDAGLKIVIIAVHIQPERALENTFRRFEEFGRGASIDVMAKIQGNLPFGLTALKERFGEQITLKIYDYTDLSSPSRKIGWEHLDTLQKEGSYDQIKQRLTSALEHARREGRITEACYEHAHGRVSKNISRSRSLGGEGNGGNQKNESGRRVQERDSQKVIIDQENRIQNIPKLKDSAGVEYVFWKHASTAISKAGNVENVNWRNVESMTIIESIGSHGQKPDNVFETLCAISPGAVTQQQQAELQNKIRKLTPELQAQYAKKQTKSKESGLER